MSNHKKWSQKPDYSLDLTKKYTATICTDLGDIIISLFADKVPMTVNNFVFLANEGYFDNIDFSSRDSRFMAQAGIQRERVWAVPVPI